MKAESAEEFAKRCFKGMSRRMLIEDDEVDPIQLIEARDEQIRAEGRREGLAIAAYYFDNDPDNIRDWNDAERAVARSMVDGLITIDPGLVERIRAEIERRAHNNKGGAE